MSRPIKQPFGRTRNENAGVLALPQTFLRQWYISTGSNSAYSVVPSRQIQSTRVMYDTVTPGYAQRVARGEIVNNPLSKVSTLYSGSEDGGWAAIQKSGGLGWELGADTRHHLPWSSADLKVLNPDNIIRLARTAALAGAQAPVNQSLVTAGELHKTLTLMVSPLRGLTKLLKESEQAYLRDLRTYGNKINRAMKQRKRFSRQRALERIKREPVSPKSLTERLEFIPDMVLAYNLGWKPMMMEIDAIFRKIPAMQLEERRTSRSTKSDKAVTVSHDSVSPGQGILLKFDTTTTEEIIVRAGLIYRDGFSTEQHFGVRLADVPSAAWELIPFSFVLDYAVNVGDFIQALSGINSRDILAYFTTTTIKIDVVRTFTGADGGSTWNMTRNPFASDTVSYEATIRDTGPYGAALAHTAVFDWTHRPPAQLQNVLSLLTNTLMGISNRKAR